MYCAPFDYVAPDTLDEVVTLLGEAGDEASLIAGGQSLVPMMALRLATPRVLIDLGRLPGAEPALDGDDLVLPAATRHTALVTSDLVGRHAPMMPLAGPHIGNVRVRNRGTLGGSVAHADPAAEWPCVLSALGGSIRLTSTAGTRDVPTSDFFRGFLDTAKDDDEVVVEVRVPRRGGSTGHGYAQMSRRANDFAVVQVAATLTVVDGRIDEVGYALGGVADRPVVGTPDERAQLVGSSPTDAVLRDFATAVADRLEPHDDNHGTAPFRRHLARELGYGALRSAAIDGEAPA